MTTVRKLVAAIGIVLAVSACSTGRPVGADACDTRSPDVRLVVTAYTFDRSCFGVRAGQPFTLTLVNNDAGVNHDVEIMAKPFGYPPRPPIFLGTIFEGPRTLAYHVPALPAGHLFFVCYVHHDTMYGEVEVPPDAGRVDGG